MQLSKNHIKLIQSLALKKHRDALGLFVAEGDKCVADLLPLLSCSLLVATQQFLDRVSVSPSVQVVATDHVSLQKASLLNAPQQAIAVFAKPDRSLLADDLLSGLTLMLDTVQDPGNLGTIVRIADWFGISRIVCSPATADVFNPKTVQATMGAIGRVPVFYTPLLPLLQSLQNKVPVFGTFLEGDNIYQASLPSSAVILMGNEGKGISPEVAQMVSSKLFIPNFPVGVPTSESLNVAVATAITCSEFRRRPSSL